MTRSVVDIFWLFELIFRLQGREVESVLLREGSGGHSQRNPNGSKKVPAALKQEVQIIENGARIHTENTKPGIHKPMEIWM